MNNVWMPNPGEPSALHVKFTKTVLVPGDELEVIVTASDPNDAPLEYSVGGNYGRAVGWSKDNVISLPVKKEHVQEALLIEVYVRSDCEYHARGHYDDSAGFVYCVRPPRE
jgi:hypothetical protein